MPSLLLPPLFGKGGDFGEATVFAGVGGEDFDFDPFGLAWGEGNFKAVALDIGEFAGFEGGAVAEGDAAGGDAFVLVGVAEEPEAAEGDGLIPREAQFGAGFCVEAHSFSRWPG